MSDEGSCNSSPKGLGVAVGLISGGIDSPVALARLMKCGWDIHCIHFSQEPIVGPEAEQKSLTSMHILKQSQLLKQTGMGMIKGGLNVVPVAQTLALFTEGEAHRDYFVHMKRLFNAISDLFAQRVGATHLATGENLGQVSSQTLGNLGAVEEASEHTILRPLLGMDKQEIINIARKLGTLASSEGPEVCDALGPRHPTTVADLDRLRRNEEKFGGLRYLAEQCFEGLRESDKSSIATTTEPAD